MRKILEILRLHFDHHASGRAIARAVCVALATVQECLRRFHAAGLTWPSDLDGAALEALLYPPPPRSPDRPLPDFPAIQKALAGHKAMTRRHLWEAYRTQHPDGLGYSAFCEHYAVFLAQQQTVLRRVHRPGEALLVDYAGPCLYVTDRKSGERTAVRLFVAVLGYSNYTFACVTPGETTQDWLCAQTAALQALGGVPEAVVPDNPRALVSRACRYEPDLNPAYQDFARHYDVAILPARVRKPRDKAKVETAVQIVERALMPALLAQTFFSLADLNAEIRTRVAALNAKPFQKLPGSRDLAFAEERAHLRALPPRPYEYAAWSRHTVTPDYHVEVQKHRYSVPHAHIGAVVQVRISTRMIEIFREGRAIACHPRSGVVGGISTLAAHRPPAHRAVLDEDLERLLRQAEAVGPQTARVIREQGRHKKHPAEALRSAKGILRLARDYSPAALEAASLRAYELGTWSYRALRGLIEHPEVPVPKVMPVAHENVRGPGYYAGAPTC